MMLSATLNNISAISWRSVLLVKETGVHGENHRPAIHWTINSISIKYKKLSAETQNMPDVIHEHDMDSVRSTHWKDFVCPKV